MDTALYKKVPLHKTSSDHDAISTNESLEKTTTKKQYFSKDANKPDCCVYRDINKK